MRALILAAVLLVATDAWACSCATLSPAEQFGYAQLVFVGEAIGVEERFHFFRRIWSFFMGSRDDDPESYSGYEYTFAVERMWRGPGSNTVRVASGRADGNDCGIPFERGKRYLVYGNKAGGEWWTGICTRTAPAGQAAADLAFLETVR